MALYRLETKIINRQNRGRSVVRSAAYRSGNVLHSAAYRSGDKLLDEKAQATFNYRPRVQEVVHSEILAPKDGPLWLRVTDSQAEDAAQRQRDMREKLWNTIEKVEKRKDSQLAREFIAALPRELTLEQQAELVRGWCEAEFISKRFVADFSIHKSKDGKNPHAHILCTTRPVEGEGFGKKPSTAGKFNGRGAVGKGGKSDLGEWRKSWETHANAALQKAGREERVDHRSLKDRGIDRVPQPKIGKEAVAMKREGVVEDPKRFEAVRRVKMMNEVRPMMRAIMGQGEVSQIGIGVTWWEKSITFMSRIREQASRAAKNTWRKLVDASRRKNERKGPQITM